MTDERWEEFAREDAEYYVLTGIGRAPGPEARREFFASGEAEAERILATCGSHLDGRELAIEIGCGVGRVALPIARRFTRVIGVDVSPTMLKKLAENAARAEVAVEPVLADEPWDERGQADLVYSVLVFQHIDDFEAIARYVRRIARALKRTGIAYVQFDTRPRSVAYRVRNLLPDAVLRDEWRRGLRRIRRPPAQLRELFGDSGLAIVAELGAGSEEHVFVLSRT
jgi:SAM-dependent methyltransferase